MHKTFKRGFTLIELLVVIAIIGILASIILVSLNSARAKGRDADRVSSLQEMSKAMDLLDTGTPVQVTGCTIGNLSDMVTKCTSPNLTQYKDPVTPLTPCTPAGARSTAPTALGATCEYTISKVNPSGASISGVPDSENYEICTYLETGSGNLVPGAAYIGSFTGGAVEQGCP